MLKPGNVRFVKVTPEIAKQYLEVYVFERQRAQREHKVEQWAEQMTAELWLPITMVMIIWFDGRGYFVDGQHRFLAVIQSNCTETFVAAEWEAECWQDVLDAYNYTDRGMVRTSVDAYRTLRLDEKLELNGPQLRSLGAAVVPIAYNFIAWQSGWKGMKDASKIELIVKYGKAAHTFFAQVDRSAASGFERRFYRAPVTALGVVTYEHSARELDRALVVDFWQGVMSGANLDLDDPAKVAYDHLRDYGLAVGKYGKGSVSGAYHVRYLINCFNAYVRGEKFSIEGGRKATTRVPKGSLNQPVFIEGTPWQGQKEVSA